MIFFLVPLSHVHCTTMYVLFFSCRKTMNFPRSQNDAYYGPPRMTEKLPCTWTQVMQETNTSMRSLSEVLAAGGEFFPSELIRPPDSQAREKKGGQAVRKAREVAVAKEVGPIVPPTLEQRNDAPSTERRPRARRRSPVGANGNVVESIPRQPFQDSRPISHVIGLPVVSRSIATPVAHRVANRNVEPMGGVRTPPASSSFNNFPKEIPRVQ